MFKNFCDDCTASILEARKIANSFYTDATPPDLRKIGQILGVSSIEPRAMGADGYVGPGPSSNLIIRYRTGNSIERNRFTIAHELAHIILARVQGKSIGVKNRGMRSDTAEERAVDRIASELLLPEACVSKMLKERSARGEDYWDSINALRHCFHVSTTTIALRMLELPKLLSVLFRITARGFSCSCSEGKDIRFLVRSSVIAQRLRERSSERSHHLSVLYHGARLMLRLQGHERPLRYKDGLTREYWCLGWMSVARSSTPELCFSEAKGQSVESHAVPAETERLA